jgi:hypothetical protein
MSVRERKRNGGIETLVGEPTRNLYKKEIGQTSIHHITRGVNISRRK